MTHKHERSIKSETLKFRLEAAEISRLALLAKAEGVSMAAVLRRLIRAAKIPKPLDA